MPAELTDADLFGDVTAPAAPAAPSQPIAAYDNGRGISVQVGGDPDSGGWSASGPQAAPAPATQELSDADLFGVPSAPAPSPMTMAADAAKGFGAGLARAGANLTDTVLQATPIGALPQMLRTAASLGAGELPRTTPFSGMSQTVAPHLYQPQTAPGRYAQSVGEMIPNVVAPGGLARKAAAVVLPGIGAQAAGDAASALGANPTVTAAARFAGGTVGGLAAGVGVARPPKLADQPMSLEQLQKASDQAWAKVDASGYRFPQKDVRAVANDIAQLVSSEGGKELYPTAAAMAKRISSLAAQGDLSVAQLNRLRSQLGSKLMQPGSTEADIGATMKNRLDGLIETSNDPNLATARDLYTRLKKVQSVNDRLDSAGLRASSTYSGGNYTNAVRQTMRPLIDPLSKQRLRNLSPEEAESLRRVVEGTRTQNALRETSKLMGNKVVQTGAMMLTPHGIGLPLMEGAAKGLRKAGEAQTEGAVQRTIELMANGGKPAPAGPPRITYAPTGLEPFNLATLLSLSRPAPVPQPVRGR